MSAFFLMLFSILLCVMKRIESIHNPLIKNILKLQEKSRERKKQGLFVIEGKKEIQLAIKAGYELKSTLYITDEYEETFENQHYGFEIIQVTPEVYRKIAYRGSTEKIIAIAKTKFHEFSELKLSKNPLILIAEGIEKPGNIGAMLRTADAAKIDAVILADPKADIYNPNVIRSSIGCLFTNQVVTGKTKEIIAFLNQKNINIYAATLQNSNVYIEEDYSKPTAIVVGTEATGLTSEWRENAKQNINIPMKGEIDSMNVSVSAAILLYEALRQRKFK